MPSIADSWARIDAWLAAHALPAWLCSGPTDPTSIAAALRRNARDATPVPPFLSITSP
jgi:hypothetical protein